MPTATPPLSSTPHGLAPAGDPAAGLRRIVAAAARHAQVPAQLAMAAARLSPVETTAWLLSLGPSAGELLGDDGVAELVDVLAGQALARGQLTLAEGVCEAALRHAHAVLPDTAATLAAALPPERRPAALRPLCERVLDRAPRHPALLRAAAELALERGDGARAHALLDRLGQADPSPATAGWVASARGRAPAPPAPPIGVALLGSFTLNPLVPFLDLELRAAGLLPSITLGGYGAWEREVADENDPVWAADLGLGVIAAHVDDLVPALAGDPTPGELRAAGMEAVERVVAAAERFRARSAAALAVLGFHSAHPDPSGPLHSVDGRAAILAELNRALAERVEALPDAWVVDLGEVTLRRAGGAADEPKLRHLARMRLPPAALPALARSLAGIAVAAKGLTRKCLLLDLDDTLWGGLAGEDGVGGVRLGDTAPGSEFVELQHALKALAGRGVLLAVASKNNEDDALAVIRGHGAMVLREADFAALRINWRPKHENAAEIAAELGIGLESMVFVDNSPDERARMRAMLPQVLTPELPADPALFRRTLQELPQLRVARVTDEDRARTALYRARAGRMQAQRGAGSLDEYLRGLGVEVHVEPAPEAALARAHQLFARTNQFNLTTRRYAHAELQARAADPAWRLYVLRARDRHGDHGLVSCALVRVEESAWTVDNLVLSCRALGCGVETALLAAIGRAARRAGATHLRGELADSGKNAPAHGFWARHGFTRVDDGSGGVERWELALDGGGVAAPPWICLEGADEA
ncbi:MAG TPA: HAD-IIIC family phosphatase [Longimicrobium sp.]|nr:HAD-IIIC family phosphatase [Longimicrobium sp.]